MIVLQYYLQEHSMAVPWELQLVVVEKVTRNRTANLMVQSLVRPQYIFLSEKQEGKQLPSRQPSTEGCFAGWLPTLQRTNSVRQHYSLLGQPSQWFHGPHYSKVLSPQHCKMRMKPWCMSLGGEKHTQSKAQSTKSRREYSNSWERVIRLSATERIV